MGGGLMQLVAYGAQDIYLTGNPQITFFKVVYRRHTNFSMEAIAQTWNGSETSAGRCTATISRNGDLVYRMYLELKCTSVVSGPDANMSSTAINDVELEIGGQKIDKHTGHWMNVWSHLTEPNPSGRVGSGPGTDGTLFQNMSGMGGQCGIAGSGSSLTPHHFVPLQFWFCRNPGLALPLIALQYHEVKVILDHDISGTGRYSGGTPSNTLWCDYIYLDTDERRRFAQVSHEYLIEQVQEGELSSGTNDLNFNHPVKELIFTPTTVSAGSLSGTGIQLKLNGHDRFAGRDIKYFTRTQIWEHHSGAGGLDASDGTADDGKFIDSIGVYSFALKPEEHQPSGTCNFSRIDNAQLTGLSGASKIFAVNYNVLRIMSGMGGLAYSN
jgi:hypothetical protein